MKEFLNEEIGDVQRKMCELAEEYVDEWNDRYYTETPPKFDEEAPQHEINEYHQLIGELTGLNRVWDYLVETFHPDFRDE